jgi:hypothetical protein
MGQLCAMHSDSNDKISSIEQNKHDYTFYVLTSKRQMIRPEEIDSLFKKLDAMHPPFQRSDIPNDQYLLDVSEAVLFHQGSGAYLYAGLFQTLKGAREKSEEIFQRGVDLLDCASKLTECYSSLLLSVAYRDGWSFMKKDFDLAAKYKQKVCLANALFFSSKDYKLWTIDDVFKKLFSFDYSDLVQQRKENVMSNKESKKDTKEKKSKKVKFNRSIAKAKKIQFSDEIIIKK